MRHFSLFNIFSNEHFQQIEVVGASLFGHNEVGVLEMALQKESACLAKCIKIRFLVSV